MLRVANSCAWSRCFGRAKNPMGAQGLLRGAAPQRELRNRRALEALLGAGRDRSGRAAGGRVFDAKLTPKAVRQRLLPSAGWSSRSTSSGWRRGS